MTARYENSQDTWNGGGDNGDIGFLPMWTRMLAS